MYTIVRIDEWEGLYDVDGQLLTEDHQITIEDLQAYLSHITLGQISIVDFDGTPLQSYTEENGTLPETLHECKEIAEG